MGSSLDNSSSQNELKSFLLIIANSIFLLVVSLGLAVLFKVSPHDHLGFSIRNILIGMLAVGPLAVFLWWFMRTEIKSLADFRVSQIDFFADLGFRLTPIRILMISLAAGICEELLFRGVLQVALYPITPVAIAILLPSTIFGLLHMRTIIYAVIAGLVGAYLGLLFALTGSLLAAIVCHTVYDIIALDVTRRAIKSRQRENLEEA